MRTDWHHHHDGDAALPVVVWHPSAPRRALSSATLGGGLRTVTWVLNATVAPGYDRSDPDVHLAGIAAEVGLTGEGIGLMTAVDVRGAVAATDHGAEVRATVGVDQPTWAAAEALDWHGAVVPTPGTINLVVELPVRLTDAALVNAVATATEAKCQAMIDAGLAGTGTPTDAVCVLCPTDGPAEPYGGPRSVWGSRLARAVHAAVGEGLGAWRSR